MQKSVRRLVKQRLVFGEMKVILSNKQYRGARFVELAFGKLPQGEYTVTYTLDPKGNLTVSKGECWNRVNSNNDSLVVCFLPDAWDGLRVSRTVSIRRAYHKRGGKARKIGGGK